MPILMRSPFTERWEPSTGRRSVGDIGEGYKLQAVHFLKLRRSLIYDLFQGSWKVGHSFMKSSGVTLCEVCRLAEENDGVMLIHLRSPITERWAQGNGQRCVGDFGEGEQVALHRSRSRQCVRCVTVQDMLEVPQTTYVLVEHLRSWSWGKDLWNSVAKRSRWWFRWVPFLSTIQILEHLQSLMLYAAGAVSVAILYSRWHASIVGVKLKWRTVTAGW